VYVPLRTALDEVTWEIRVRSVVTSYLEHLSGQVVQSRLRVERGDVELRMLVVGTSEDAAKISSELVLEITRVAGVPPHVEVLAVPDAKELSGLAAQLHDVPVPVEKKPEPPPVASELLARGYAPLRSRVQELWPSAQAGVIVGVWVEPQANDGLRVVLLHIGKALDDTARSMLERMLGETASTKVSLVAFSVPEELSPNTELDQFAAELAAALARAAMAKQVSACVEQPPRPPANRKARDYDQLLAELRVLSRDHANVHWLTGPAWRVRFTLGSCEVNGTSSASSPANAPQPEDHHDRP
jgi:hypothetical protein